MPILNPHTKMEASNPPGTARRGPVRVGWPHILAHAPAPLVIAPFFQQFHHTVIRAAPGKTVRAWRCFFEKRWGIKDYFDYFVKKVDWAHR
jgi:hypothetical protein